MNEAAKVPDHFKDWVETYQTILSFIDTYGEKISRNEQIALALHLLLLYSYNAGLTEREINYLEYQASPLQYRKGNSYLRIDTNHPLIKFASELIHEKLEQHEKKYAFIIDHLNFKQTFQDYFSIYTGIEDILSKVPTVKDTLNKKLESIKEKLGKKTNIYIYIENETLKSPNIVLNIYLKLIGDFLGFEDIYLNHIKNVITGGNITIKGNFFEKIKARYENKIEDFKKNDVSFLKNLFTKEIQETAENIAIGYTKEIEDICIFITPHISKKMQRKITDNVHFQQFGYTPDIISLAKKLINREGNPIEFINKILDTQLKIAGKDTKTQLKLIPNLIKDKNITLEPKNNTIDSYVEIFLAFKRFCGKNIIDYIRIESCAIINILEGLKIFDHADFISIDLIVLRRLNKELKEAVINVTENSKDMPKFIRNIQNIHEAILLYLSLHPLPRNEEYLTSSAIKNLLPFEYLQSIQNIHLCNYGMKTFSQTFMASKYTLANPENNDSLQVSNQNYFEFLLNANGSNLNVYHFRKTQDIKNNGKIIFLDIHPNNSVESELYGHNVSDIFNQIWPGHQRIDSEKNLGQKDPYWILLKNKELTLIIDVTLNDLQDEEINGILDNSKKFIDEGLLNLVFVQSLTKFTQLGLDKLSAGLIIAYNNASKYWMQFNQDLKSYQEQESVDPLIHDYFFVLYKYAFIEQKEYLDKIRKNTRYLYNCILAKYNHLQISPENRILEITCNADEKTSYIAINYQSFFEKTNITDYFTDDDFEDFCKVVTLELLIPIVRGLKLPVAHRMSIGFPFVNIHNTVYTIRLTVGLEEESILDLHADIIAYACHALSLIDSKILLIKEKRDERKLAFDKIVNEYKPDWHKNIVDRKNDSASLIITYPSELKGIIKFAANPENYDVTITTNSQEPAKAQTLKGDKLHINKNILNYFLVSTVVDPSNNSLSEEDTHSYSSIEESNQYYDGYFADKAAWMADSDNSYNAENCVTFSDLTLDQKKLLFPKLPYFHIEIINAPVTEVESLELTKRDDIGENGYSIYKTKEKNNSEFITIELDLWSIKSLTVAKFCRLLCIYLIFQNASEPNGITYTDLLGLAYKKFKIKEDNFNMSALKTHVEKITIVARKYSDMLKNYIKHYLEEEISIYEVKSLIFDTKFLDKFNQKIDELYKEITASVITYIPTEDVHKEINNSSLQMAQRNQSHGAFVKRGNQRNILAMQSRANKQALDKTAGYKNRNYNSDQKNFLYTPFQSFALPFFPRIDNKFRDAFKNKLISENENIMEHICNLTISRDHKKLRIFLEFPAIDKEKEKNIYRQLGYWLKNNLQKDIIEDFDAKKKGLFIILSSSQEAKDLKNLLNETVQLFRERSKSSNKTTNNVNMLNPSYWYQDNDCDSYIRAATSNNTEINQAMLNALAANHADDNDPREFILQQKQLLESNASSYEDSYELDEEDFEESGLINLETEIGHLPEPKQLLPENSNIIPNQILPQNHGSNPHLIFPSVETSYTTNTRFDHTENVTSEKNSETTNNGH